MTKIKKTPNPGSSEAYAEGCKCPILDNNHGRGDGPFWMSENCPLHGFPPVKEVVKKSPLMRAENELIKAAQLVPPAQRGAPWVRAVTRLKKAAHAYAKASKETRVAKKPMAPRAHIRKS